MKIVGSICVLLVAGALIAFFSQTVAAKIQQDNCSFGSVTNAAYRMLLDEATQKEEAPQLPLDFSNSEVLSAGIQRRLDQMLAHSDSAYEEIATIHAVMRSLGAIYRSTKSDVRMRGQDPFVDGPHPYLILGYHLDLNAHGYFRPYRRWVRILVHLHPTVDRGQIDVGAPRVYASIPQLLDPSYPTLASSITGEHCPPVPNY